jgi:hypothetical protein
MEAMTSGPEPRWTYAKPTEKAQPGMPKQLGYDIKAYNLPVIDVQTEKRNFPGYTEANYYSLDEIRMGDESGTTETDDATAPKSGGYTTINKKSGPKDKWPNKRS